MLSVEPVLVLGGITLGFRRLGLLLKLGLMARIKFEIVHIFTVLLNLLILLMNIARLGVYTGDLQDERMHGSGTLIY